MGPVWEGGEQPAGAGQDGHDTPGPGVPGGGPPAGAPPPARRPRAGALALALVCLLAAAALILLTRPFGARPRPGQPAPLYSEAWAESRLPEGQPAPDFVLKSFPGGEEVRLSSLRGRAPVVLAFGSFTCDLFCDSLGRLAELSREYRGRALFYLVYIAEAGHPLPFPGPAGGRLARVRKGLEFFRVPFPCLVAPPDSQVEKDYDPWPTRLLLLARDGRVALDAGRGTHRPPWDLAGIEARLQSLAGSPEAGPQPPTRPRRESGGGALRPIHPARAAAGPGGPGAPPPLLIAPLSAGL